MLKPAHIGAGFDFNINYGVNTLTVIADMEFAEEYYEY